MYQIIREIRFKLYSSESIKNNQLKALHMHATICRGIALLFALFAISTAFAQQTAVSGVGFKLGDDIQTVKAALKTSIDPEPMERSPALSAATDPNKGKTVLHLRTKGIWAFFSPAGKVETIRLDAPYSDAVLGIKLGDSLEKLTARLGAPIKKPWAAFVTMQAYQYVLDDSAYVNFDLNDDGVQYIFLTK